MGKTMGKGAGRKQGFTLIELLVVISIVSLLSSVVLASLNGARVKADDTQRNQIVGEYVKALALAYDKQANGQYPGTADNNLYCLGDYSPVGTYGTPNACRYGISAAMKPENATVENALSVYLSGLPTLKSTVFSATITYDGPFYKCSATDCSTPTIEWYLIQTNQKCIKGATATFPVTGGIGTKCILTLN